MPELDLFCASIYTYSTSLVISQMVLKKVYYIYLRHQEKLWAIPNTQEKNIFKSFSQVKDWKSKTIMFW